MASASLLKAELRPQPRRERIDDGAASGLTDVSALLGWAAADLPLDAIEFGDPRERFHGDRRGTALREIVKLSPDVRPTEGQAHGIAVGQDLAACVAIDLQRAHEALKMPDRLLGLAIRRIKIGQPGRVRSVPGTVVASVGEELAGLGSAAARVEHRRRGLICEELGRRLQPLEQTLMDRP